MIWEDVLGIARRFNDHYSMSEEQQRMLWELAKGVPPGGLIVELGVCHGKTAAVLALAAREQKATYLGIDNWSLEGTFQEVWQLLVDARIGDQYWHLLKENTHDESFRSAAPDGVDFLVIDAGHDEANVMPDCELWIPKVVPGGIVVFDDVPSGPDWWESPHVAVRREMTRWTNDWEWAASWGKTVARRRPL